MKRTLVTGLLFVLFGMLYAQSNSLREVVSIVRPVYSESTVKFLESYSDRLKKQGYDSLSVQMKRYAKGNSFGSGFAYINPTDSQTYILTNSHVVVQAQYVNVEFVLEDQSVKTFANCKIVSVDFENDLALVSLPQGVKLDRTLALSSQKAEDAEDVFTAGYPGLADKASWQLGKGIVSNANIHLDGWIPTKNSIIQHTAQIDPGSSGGPLLRRNPNAPRGFEIIGMNTWKVRDRENANFSIHASIIKNFIETYLKGDNKMSKESLQKQAQDFIGVAKDGYKPILPFVSYEYISRITIDKFFELYRATTTEIRKEVKSQFEEKYPIEAVRVIISSIIATNIAKKNLTFESIENFTTNGPVVVNMKDGDKTIKTTWVPDQGSWRISNMESVKFEDDRIFKIDNNFGYSGSVTYVTNSDMKHDNFSYIEILTQRTIATFYTTGLGYCSGQLFNTPSDSEDNNYTEIRGLELHNGAQLPLKIGLVHIVPYLRLLGGLDLGSDFVFAVHYGYRLGLEADVHLSGNTYLLTGIGIRNRYYFLETTDMRTTNSLSFFVGISY
ncbi:MAG TPA: serine protease [Bacteroidales bacterium]|nr:serine protease [Bacteroidales bacterium]